MHLTFILILTNNGARHVLMQLLNDKFDNSSVDIKMAYLTELFVQLSFVNGPKIAILNQQF